jgi:predicted Fe-Mo cluster-binding NifX family protein
MKVAVSAVGGSLDAAVDPRFGRAPYFVIVDSESGAAEAVPNASISEGHGAGVQTAQWVAQQGVEAVIAGSVGPNAFQVLDASGIGVYRSESGTVAEAVAALGAGRLTALTGASGPAHVGRRGF